jgi:hypothetical protein
VLQATVCDGGKLDASAFGDDLVCPAEVDVGRRQVFDTLMITDVIVVLDEGANRGRDSGRRRTVSGVRFQAG